MARISNTSIYPNVDPVLADYFVLTDANDDLSTKTCTLESVQSLFGLADTNVTVTVSSVLLNALWTQPLTLIAAPGSGYVLNIKNIISCLWTRVQVWYMVLMQMLVQRWVHIQQEI